MREPEFWGPERASAVVITVGVLVGVFIGGRLIRFDELTAWLALAAQAGFAGVGLFVAAELWRMGRPR